MQDPENVELIADPLERAIAAHALIGEYQRATVEASKIRKASLHQLLRERANHDAADSAGTAGLRQIDVAGLLGLTRSRISKVLSDPPAQLRGPARGSR